MLHLESIDVGEQWRPRYFQLQQHNLAYFDISAPADVSHLCVCVCVCLRVFHMCVSVCTHVCI